LAIALRSIGHWSFGDGGINLDRLPFISFVDAPVSPRSLPPRLIRPVQVNIGTRVTWAQEPDTPLELHQTRMANARLPRASLEVSTGVRTGLGYFLAMMASSFFHEDSAARPAGHVIFRGIARLLR